MRARIGSTIAIVAVAVGIATSLAGPVYSAIGGSPGHSSHRPPMSTNRII